MPDLNSFKVALKKWRPVNCPCRICKVYIANAGFVLKLILPLILYKPFVIGLSFGGSW